MSYTYAILEISQAAYAEIREKLVAAGYAAQIAGICGTPDEVIDMHGIAVQAETESADVPSL